MFFQKKKDKEKEKDPSSAAAAAAVDKKAARKDKKKDKAEPLSKEEIERLEETKTRLFGHLGRRCSFDFAAKSAKW